MLTLAGTPTIDKHVFILLPSSVCQHKKHQDVHDNLIDHQKKILIPCKTQTSRHAVEIKKKFYPMFTRALSHLS